MSHSLYQIAQQICLSFPASEEFVSHGAPNFRVKKGKIFAVYAQNFHGDKRVAPWLNSPPGAQAAWVQPKASGVAYDADYFTLARGREDFCAIADYPGPNRHRLLR